MIKMAGNNGGTLLVREKGDPSPNKGKKRLCTASLINSWRKQSRAQLGKKDYDDALRFLLEIPEKELEGLLKREDLPVGLAVEARGWLDKRNGAENLRKSKERLFGKPQEHTDITTAGETLNNPFMDMQYDKLKKFYESIQAKKRMEAKKKKNGSNVGKE